jgi:hypothetical protein
VCRLEALHHPQFNAIPAKFVAAICLYIARNIEANGAPGCSFAYGAGLGENV